MVNMMIPLSCCNLWRTSVFSDGRFILLGSSTCTSQPYFAYNKPLPPATRPRTSAIAASSAIGQFKDMRVVNIPLWDSLCICPLQQRLTVEAGCDASDQTTSDLAGNTNSMCPESMKALVLSV